MDTMTSSYNLGLVLLSILMATFGSFTALQLAIRIPTAEKVTLNFWVLSSGLALGGGGIWSMHFIGMLAMNSPFAMQFDVALTVLSFAISVTFVSIGLLIAGRDLLGDASLVAGGSIAGLGVASMHYLGMYAMIIPATITYDTTIVAVSIVIGMVASTTALWLAFNLRGLLQRFGSAVIMGLAVSSMHYIGMYAATMTANEEKVLSSTNTLSVNGLAGIVFVVTAILLIALLFLSYLKNKSTQQFA